eukprot:Opistho-2@65289
MDDNSGAIAALQSLAQDVLRNIKGSTSGFEDLLKQAGKHHTQLKATAATSSAFTAALAEVARTATDARGGTAQIGHALQQLVDAQRKVDAHLAEMARQLETVFATTLQAQVAKESKTVGKLEKQFEKSAEKGMKEIKKAGKATIKVEKAALKGKKGADAALEAAKEKMSESTRKLEDFHKETVRHFLIKERKRYCAVVSGLEPYLREAVSMHAEASSDMHSALQAAVDNAAEPDELPQDSEALLDSAASGQAQPPSSGQPAASRRMSMPVVSRQQSQESSSSAALSSSAGARLVSSGPTLLAPGPSSRERAASVGVSSNVPPPMPVTPQRNAAP